MAFYSILIIELILNLFRTSRVTYFFALSGLYNICSTLYFSYHVLGFTTFNIVLIAHLPFISSFVRMYMRDTERNRLTFFRNCCKMWVLTLAIDVWVTCSTTPVVTDLCHFVDSP